MKTLKQILENASTQSLLVLCLITMVIGAGIGATLVTTTGSLKIHGRARHPSGEAANASFPVLAVSDSASAGTAPAGGGTAITRANPPGFDNGSKTAGTILIRGTLSGSVKPTEDQPWRHWLN